MRKTIFFIPIRKGSKGIPNKNVNILGGKPLVCWIIDTLQALDEHKEIWIATDSEYAQQLLTNRYGDTVNIYRRSSQSATDVSPVIEVVNEFIAFHSISDETNFVLTQATSPLTSVGDFTKLMEYMNDNVFDSYISCCRVKKFCWSETGKPLNYSLDNKPMRQNYSGILMETGAFYASSVRAIKQSGMLLSGNIKIVETGEGTMIDIDNERDWQIAELFIKNNRNHE